MGNLLVWNEPLIGSGFNKRVKSLFRLPDKTLSEALRAFRQIHLHFEPARKTAENKLKLFGLPLIDVMRSAVRDDIEHFDGWFRTFFVKMLHDVVPPLVVWCK